MPVFGAGLRAPETPVSRGDVGVGSPALLDDQSRASIERQVRPPPLKQHQQSIPKSAQVVDVDLEPQNPRGETGDRMLPLSITARRRPMVAIWTLSG